MCVECLSSMNNKYLLPDELSITCTLQGKPVSGILVSVTARMQRKNHFDLVVGPTDIRGQITCTRNNILEQAESSRNLFLMDYADPVDNFSGEIEVSPMSRHDIKRALDAYNMFADATKYPEKWKETLESADRVLVSLDPKSRIDISVRCSDSTIKLVEVPCIVGERP